jgi:hypothetical protein
MIRRKNNVSKTSMFFKEIKCGEMRLILCNESSCISCVFVLVDRPEVFFFFVVAGGGVFFLIIMDNYLWSGSEI